MMKVQANIEVEIPEGLLTYDLGTEHLRCEECKRGTGRLKISKDDGPDPRTFMREFIREHAACVVNHERKHRERRIREDASQPCRQDYRDASGGGPHECGKTQGHGGGCGPG